NRAARSGDPQQRAAAIDRAFGHDLHTAHPHRDTRKIGDDAAGGIGEIVFGPDGHTQIRRDQDRDVTVAGGEERIREGAAAEQAGDDAADGGGNPHGAGDVGEANGAGAGFTADTGSGIDPDGACHVARDDDPAGFADDDGAATGRGGDRTAGSGNANSAARGIGADRAAHVGDFDITACCFENGIAADILGGDTAAAGGTAQAAIDFADLGVAAARSEAGSTANAVALHLTGGGFDGEGSIAAIGFDGAFGGRNGGSSQPRGLYEEVDGNGTTTGGEHP